MTSAPRALILDLDDTILAHSDGAAECWDRACAEFTSLTGGADPARLRAAIDAYRDWFWSDSERHRRGRLDLDAAREEIVAGALRWLGTVSPAAARAIARRYSELREEGIRPFPGAVEALQELRQRDLRLALLTNGDGAAQRRKIDRFGLAEQFDCVLIEGEVGWGKPEERCYQHALARLGALAADAWIVGDNLEWEVAVPQRLGIYSVWIDCKGSGLPPGCTVRPDRTLRALAELPACLGPDCGVVRHGRG
jgi:putative hydrolase of the HAD superfamily